MSTKMRPLGQTIPLADAQAIVRRAVRPIERIQRASLPNALNRVLARDVVSSADVPPFDRAAMDGYAVRAADTAGASRATPVVLRCLEQVFTGQIAAHTVAKGQCAEIATGAPMPGGADAVVIVEETETDESGMVRVCSPVVARQNIGRKGGDIYAGQTVLAAGDHVTAARLGALAALGAVDVDVYARPTVAILSTGNEIVDPGQPLAPGQIYDINKFTLAAVVSAHGGVPVLHRTAVDTIEDLTRAVDACLAQDVLVFSGGSSVGERDLILDALEARGEVLFHGISIKPGKPTAFGTVAGKPVFGMPGYPTSCLTNAHILLAPTLRRIARLPEDEIRSVRLPLAQRIISAPGRHQFYTVRIENNAVVPAFKTSGAITSMSRADGYIEIPIDVDSVEAGAMVTVTLF